MTTNEEPKTQPPEEKPKVEKHNPRIFVYDGREFSDPDPKMTTDEVRQYYATFFPELANAEVLAAVARPSKTTPPSTEQVTEFKRRTGTKGGTRKTSLTITKEADGTFLVKVSFAKPDQYPRKDKDVIRELVGALDGTPFAGWNKE